MERKKILAVFTLLLLSGCYSPTPMPYVQEAESMKVDQALDTLEQHLQKEGWSKGKTLSPKAKGSPKVVPARHSSSKPVPPPPPPPKKGKGKPQGQNQESASKDSWIDKVDLDKLLNSSWLMLGIFLLLQWFEIWYYNRTGKSSKTIDSMEAGLNPRLGILQKILYRYWRRNYFRAHPDRKDPDLKEEQTKDGKEEEHKE